MIPYDPKKPIQNIFRFQRAATFRKLLPFVAVVAVYSWGIAYLEMEFWQLADTSNVRNITIMHSLLGFAISMLLVFRTNTAYDRWWEGRKLWGSLVNNSRTLAIKLSVVLPDSEKKQKIFFRKMISAYAKALHEHLLRKSTGTALFEDDEHAAVVKKLDPGKHIPNQILRLIFSHIQELYHSKVITGEELLYINSELSSFADICGSCERIKNTPIPYSYNLFIKSFIFIYVVTLPFGYVFSLGYYVIPVVAFIFYVLASLELIAEEIEDPFGGDPNDVPTHKIAEMIGKNVEEVL